MKKEEISVLDLRRILIGEAPIVFLFEVLIRSVITYIILLIVLKLLGKRMSGRLTNTEMSVMLMFGAVVSSGMQIPDRGVLESCFVLLLILVFQRLFTWWTTKRPSMEKATLGTVSLIIKDGVIQPEFMEKELLSQRQLFRQLRRKNVYQLGELKRVYMETNGNFTVIRAKNERPGLAVFPHADKEVWSLLEERRDLQICSYCGLNRLSTFEGRSCSSCGNDQWVAAMKKRTVI